MQARLALLAGLVVVTCAVGLAFTLGPGYAGYDASWSLVWGNEIAHGALPSYDAAVAPTPHPLANVVAAVVSPLGDGGEDALVGLTFLAFAALLAGVVVLGARLWSAWAGVVAAVVLGSRGLLDREVAFASVDVPFLALAVWAGALMARSARHGNAVLVLLALAGLLRPEAWLLSLAYVVWRWRLHELHRGMSLALSAPVLWAMSDLVVTGDPLHSLIGTRDLAAELDRPTGLSTAISGLPSSLVDVVGTAPLLAGCLGLLSGLVLAPRRMALLLVALACGVATFLVLGVAGLPVLLRYLLLPACVVTVGAGIGVLAPWRAEAGAVSIGPLAVSLATAALLLSSIPGTIDDLRAARAFTRARGDVHRDLRAVVTAPAFVAAARRCPQIRVPDFRTRPVLLRDGSIDPRRVVVGNLADGERGLLLTYGSPRASAVFTLGAQGEVRLQALPAGGTLVARNRSWIADAVC